MYYCLIDFCLYFKKKQITKKKTLILERHIFETTPLLSSNQNYCVANIFFSKLQNLIYFLKENSVFKTNHHKSANEKITNTMVAKIIKRQSINYYNEKLSMNRKRCCLIANNTNIHTKQNDLNENKYW